MKPDPAAASISIVVLVLSAVGVPRRFGLGPEDVTAWGGIIVALAAMIRLLVRRYTKQPFDLRDAIGVLIGATASALGIEGTAVDQLDPDAIAMMGSGLAAAFAAHRADWISPAPPSTTGLLLLVSMSGCASYMTCTEYAAKVVGEQWSGEEIDVGDALLVADDMCRREVHAGRSVCMYRGLGSKCVLGVRGDAAGK